MKMKSIFVAIILIFIAIATNVNATNVGGTITSNVTWTLANSPYTLVSDVEIAPGTTVLVEEGVTIDGNKRELWVWGDFNAIGSDLLRVKINNVYFNIGASSMPSELGNIEVRFAQITGGSFRNNGGYAGALILCDSIIKDLSSPFDWGILLCIPSAPCYIDRNIFNMCKGIDACIWKESIYIRNNVFFEQTTDYAVTFRDGDDGYTPDLIIQSNSFLTNTKIALRFSMQTSLTDIVTTNNYWNTTDTSVIGSMIYDRNDDFSLNQYMVYSPFLTSPHPDTPVFLPDQRLTIQAEPADANTIIPIIGEHVCSGLVDISAQLFIDCPDVYKFDHWIGDVADINSASTTVFMDSDKTITAVFIATRECGDECHPDNLFGDYNHDCIIDFKDFAAFADNWLVCTKPECD